MTAPATTWPAANKDLIGTAVGAGSRVWFSCANGIVTEVFYPAPDSVGLRSFELGILDDNRLYMESTDTVHAVTLADPEVPFGRFVNRTERFQIEKEVVADPIADVVLVRIRLTGDQLGKLYCFADPHLGDRGDDTTAYVGEHKGVPILFAERSDGLAFALACSAPILDATANFADEGAAVQLRAHGELVTRRDRAEHGLITLAAQVDHRAVRGEITFALAFARLPREAAHAALSSLHRGFAWTHARYVADWKQWHANLQPPPPAARRPLWTTSATVLKTLEAGPSTGGRVAALATPWGPSRGPGLAGTYHLVWTRDLVQSVSGLLAAGASDEVRRAMSYLHATQDAAGHWPQNMRISGEPVWNGDELDEVALPLLFVARVARAGLASEAELAAIWPMVERAARWIREHGPATKLDRWEDTAGVTPFSIATAIVALLSAAELAAHLGHRDAVAPLVTLADEWNASIDALLYRTGGPLADRLGIPGYYVRARQPRAPLPELDLSRLPTTELSPDALALVRFGLRAADDPKIVATVRAIDAVLRTDLPSGPAWRRYPGDRYGEHADGTAFDAEGRHRGIGRSWPLLVGERAHYEIARGDLAEAARLAGAIEGFASATGMISEQVWDEVDVPARRLVRGRATHSASPLGWAHAEYIMLCRSLAAGRVFDLPAVSYERYLADPRASPALPGEFPA